jgi:hypothetical protein
MNKFLSQLGDFFGIMLDIDRSYKTSSMRTIEKLLIEIDMMEGLPKNIEIVIRNFVHRKILDYI